jgi:hypothetical protein
VACDFQAVFQLVDAQFIGVASDRLGIQPGVEEKRPAVGLDERGEAPFAKSLAAI